MQQKYFNCLRAVKISAYARFLHMVKCLIKVCQSSKAWVPKETPPPRGP